MIGENFSAWLMFSGVLLIYTSPITVSTACIWQICARFPPGHCPQCGYNLTGNESGVCPECATPALKQEATA